MRTVANVEGRQPDPAALDVVDLGLLQPDDVPFGRLSAKAGDAAFRYLERANALAGAGLLDAICTAPLDKEALHTAATIPATPRCSRS